MKLKVKPLGFVSVVLLLLVGLWWAWPENPLPVPAPTKPPQSSRRSDGGNQSPSAVSDAVTGLTKSRRSKAEPPRFDDAGERDPVDSILEDPHLSIEESARKLHELAVNPSLPLDQRREALGHGLNLDITPFVDFAVIPHLPAELASDFLDAVINCNEQPALQIRSYLALIKYPEPEVRETAERMFRFILGDDQDEEDLDALIHRADQRLRELEMSTPRNSSH